MSAFHPIADISAADRTRVGRVLFPDKSKEFREIMLRRKLVRVLSVSLAAAIVGVANPALGRTALKSAFSIDGSSVSPGETLVVRRGHDVMRVILHSPNAVRLLSDVDPLSSEIGATNASYPLRSGAILLGLENRPGTYCTPIYSRGLGLAGPCLVDTDRDGKFDAVSKAGFTSKSADVLIVTPKRKIVGATLADAHALASPVAYTTVERQTAPDAEGRLTWASTFKRSDPTRPVKIAFWIDASKDRDDAAVLSEPVQLTFTGEPTPVRIGGLALTVQGFDENGALRVHFDALQLGGRTDFGFRNAPAPIFIYIAH